MQTIWINVQCLKCGTAEQRTYIVHTLDEFQKLFTLECPSCKNKDHTRLRLENMEVELAKKV